MTASAIPTRDREQDVEGAQLRLRDALADWAHVPADLVFEGRAGTTPLVTVAVPTFRRPDLLADTVRSVLAQTFDGPVELIVVDNDPASGGATALLAAIPALERTNFRYFVNAENIGMFGNFNRCIELARGEWLTILNDDDLLDPDFLALMMTELRRDARIDGLVCHKRSLDERADQPDERRTLLHRAAVRLFNMVRFAGRTSRRVDAAKLFWTPGGVVGNTAGFLFRRKAGLAIGGFLPEESMAADYWFYARFRQRYRLYQHRATAAVIRIGRNESLKRETIEAFLVWTHRLHRAMLGRDLPAWWRIFAPLITARQQAYHRDYWRIDMSREEVGHLLGVPVATDRPWLYKAARLIMRGY